VRGQKKAGREKSHKKAAKKDLRKKILTGGRIRSKVLADEKRQSHQPRRLSPPEIG
jgi:hypothetical protein